MMSERHTAVNVQQQQQQQQQQLGQKNHLEQEDIQDPVQYRILTYPYPEGRKYLCTACNKAFKRHEHLRRHLTTHTGEKTHLCSFPNCLKKFSRSDELKRHHKIHFKVKSKKSQNATSNTSTTTTTTTTTTTKQLKKTVAMVKKMKTTNKKATKSVSTNNRISKKTGIISPVQFPLPPILNTITSPQNNTNSIITENNSLVFQIAPSHTPLLSVNSNVQTALNSTTTSPTTASANNTLFNNSSISNNSSSLFNFRPLSSQSFIDALTNNLNDIQPYHSLNGLPQLGKPTIPSLSLNNSRNQSMMNVSNLLTNNADNNSTTNNTTGNLFQIPAIIAANSGSTSCVSDFSSSTRSYTNPSSSNSSQIISNKPVILPAFSPVPTPSTASMSIPITLPENSVLSLPSSIELPTIPANLKMPRPLLNVPPILIKDQTMTTAAAIASNSSNTKHSRPVKFMFNDDDDDDDDDEKDSDDDERGVDHQMHARSGDCRSASNIHLPSLKKIFNTEQQ